MIYRGQLTTGTSMERFISTRDIRREDITGRLFEGSGDGPHHGILVLHGAGGGGG